MKHIFYLIGVAFIVYEMAWILNPKSQADKSRLLKEESKKNKDKKWENKTKEYKDLMKTKGLSSLIFTLWMVVGLFTFNWPVFLLVLVFNFIIIAPIGKLLKYGIGYTFLHWVNSIIGFTFGVFVVINSYHLKINTYDWLLRWFNSI